MSKKKDRARSGHGSEVVANNRKNKVYIIQNIDRKLALMKLPNQGDEP